MKYMITNGRENKNWPIEAENAQEQIELMMGKYAGDSGAPAEAIEADAGILVKFVKLETLKNADAEILEYEMKLQKELAKSRDMDSRAEIRGEITVVKSMRGILKRMIAQIPL